MGLEDAKCVRYGIECTPRAMKDLRTMMTLHPEILVKDGKKQFAVLPYEEFVSLKERLEDMEDLLQLRNAKKAEAWKPTVPLERAKRQLGLK